MKQMTYDQILDFHGHSCPGVAIGYRMSMAAMKRLSQIRSEDEEIVAIVENDACGVDALQCVSGCTFGKGNLIFRDYGKQVYTLFSRQSGKGVRVLYHGTGLDSSAKKDRKAHAEAILEAEESAILEIREVTMEEPERAQRRPSINCEKCGESTMDTRIQYVNGKPYCIPCSMAVNG